MATNCNHTIHQSHLGWNNANQPVLSIAPGETIEFKTTDSSGGQMTPEIDRRRHRQARFRQGQSGLRARSMSTAPSRAMRSRSRCSISRPAAGAGPPIFRASACSPTSSRSRRSISGNTTPRAWRPRRIGPGGRVPLKPFCGTIGLAPAEPGQHSHRAAAAHGRQHGYPRHGGGHRTLSAGGSARAACSPSAIPMPPRATAKSAARRSKAR